MAPGLSPPEESAHGLLLRLYADPEEKPRTTKMGPATRPGLSLVGAAVFVCPGRWSSRPSQVLPGPRSERLLLGERDSSPRVCWTTDSALARSSGAQARAPPTVGARLVHRLSLGLALRCPPAKSRTQRVRAQANHARRHWAPRTPRAPGYPAHRTRADRDLLQGCAARQRPRPGWKRDRVRRAARRPKRSTSLGRTGCSLRPPTGRATEAP